jgi:hypothetical protein
MNLDQFNADTRRGLDPAQPYPNIPSDETFEEEAREYIVAEDLEELAGVLIPSKFPNLFAGRARIKFCWKRTGGNDAGRNVLGRCQKIGGVTKIYSKDHFLIWLAADNCRAMKATRLQIEALLFHELCHAGVDEGQAFTVGHDYEGFCRELKEYGAWKIDLADMTRAAQQLVLPGLVEALIPPGAESLSIAAKIPGKKPREIVLKRPNKGSEQTH